MRIDPEAAADRAVKVDQAAQVLDLVIFFYQICTNNKIY